MDILNTVIKVITTAVTVFTAFQFVYIFIGAFSPKVTYKKSKKQYRYGVVICARNEEKVIGKLIESIKNQTYPADKITVFVCADSCTDGTAEICRQLGCVVYERFNSDPAKARKGYAMEFLFDNILVNYDINYFDGFAFFDADNVLAPTWFEKMNDAFATDAAVVTTYRNIKNFDTNFVSAAYGIHFCRSSMQFHRTRCRLGTSTHIAGTGYVIKSRLLKDGWHYTELTEDAEFTQNTLNAGERIIFCEDAEFFDEQPTKFRIMFRQRMRWAKGGLFVFLKNGWRRLRAIFTQKGAAKKWTNYDLFWYNFPGGLFAALLSGIAAVAGLIVGILAGTAVSDAIADVSSWDFYKTILLAAGGAYFYYTVQAAAVMIRERRHIHCPRGKKVLYVFTFFWFDIINLPINIVALLQRVRWKPIPHDKALDYSQIVRTGEGK